MDSNLTGGSYTPPPPMNPGPPAPGGMGGGELIYPTQPPKEPVLILVLNLVLVCVGYFIMGQWQKGAAALVVALVIGIPTCGIGVGLVGIFAAIDGFLQAQQLKNGAPLAQWTFFNDHR
jgi:hypothetical protein